MRCVIINVYALFKLAVLIFQLVQRCRNLVPSKRPTFMIIKKLLQKINPNHEGPIDNMILMASFTQYSSCEISYFDTYVDPEIHQSVRVNGDREDTRDCSRERNG